MMLFEKKVVTGSFRATCVGIIVVNSPVLSYLNVVRFRLGARQPWSSTPRCLALIDC